jgi:hypothetical protein
VSPWQRTCGVGPCESWSDYASSAGMPEGEARARCPPNPPPILCPTSHAPQPSDARGATVRAVCTDSLSFPLTAALVCQKAGIAARADTGRLSLLVLGPERSELCGRSKWTELLDGSHGLGVYELCVCFVGPHVPKRLDGTMCRRYTAGGSLLRCAFLRGMWHDPALQQRVPLAHASPQLALAFNSGLADFSAGWLPTLRALYWANGVPLALTSYHAPEAELDGRTLAVRLGVAVDQMCCCWPNPFRSELPHLDEIVPGQVYHSNGFLTVCVPQRV